ncbi:hypothetical protein ACFYKX_25400 [Cytobacillus sp. FJAT-54145]|uniref:Uncharacterized protein n=1 Tax=Cytobacillus spartinae TaxID=3299023 RepID=A0ABW6KK16_9BACI
MKKERDNMEINETKRSHFQPKAYRIDVMYDIAFEACANIYGKEKTELLLTIIQSGKQVDIEKLKDLPEYNKNILAEKMLDHLKDKSIPIQDLRMTFNDPRIQTLTNIISEKYKTLENTRPIKPLRILPSYQQFVKDYSKERLGETLELAIALFIVESSQFEYELIRTVFETLVEKL